MYLQVTRCIYFQVARYIYLQVARCIYLQVARCIYLQVARQSWWDDYWSILWNCLLSLSRSLRQLTRSYSPTTSKNTRMTLHLLPATEEVKICNLYTSLNFYGFCILGAMQILSEEGSFKEYIYTCTYIHTCTYIPTYIWLFLILICT